VDPRKPQDEGAFADRARPARRRVPGSRFTLGDRQGQPERRRARPRPARHQQVPLLEEGGIEAFLRREVLPHAADAWYLPDTVKTGYEISFTRYFYKPKPLRTLEEIRADILALEKETEGLLSEIVGSG
jgi:hypothetical protein